ncbi:MAG: ABC-F family ATP-binding cassette domain-containing protein [Clostridiales bacterium]|nr:ABC-F family ATP-binding cassette domain-containing protein [Candidatus Blautia equi]
MISFKEVTFGYPQKDLYNKISFEINEGDQAVLIGSNGTGKSTLLKLLMNEELFTYEGVIKKDENIRIGLVSQFVGHEDSDVTAFDYLAEPFVELQRQNDALCEEMGSAENMDEVFGRYQKVLDEMDAVDAYNYPSNIGKQLSIAGLSRIENLPVNKISGGEYKMLSIIRNMLLKPQLLIMDEPDAFLDFKNIMGLTRLINAYKGTILAITHNRLMLSQCFNKILHLENEQLQEFPGTFAEYNRAMLDTKISMQENAAKFDDFIAIQEQVIKRIRGLAENTPDPSSGRQLRARVSYLERLKIMRGENPFIEEHDYGFHFPEVGTAAKENADSETGIISETDGVTGSEAVAGADLSAAGDSAKADRKSCTDCPQEPVISVKNFSLVFDRPILTDISFDIQAGEKVAIVGANGTGKSSLLEAVYEQMKADPDKEIGFFRQIYDNDEQEMLSGGERNLRQLRALCDTNVSILFLDEPTSHLDTYAQIALEEALAEYKGTVLMVSHDFYTVANCADRILILENGGLREMSSRAYRKSIYKNYFNSELLEQERKRREIEVKVNALLKAGKHAEAKAVLEAI